MRTKLRNINIESHWLRQEVKRSLINICWVPTKGIVVDNLINALSSTQKHNSFLRMTGIEDQKDLLATIKRNEDTLQHLQPDPE